MITYCADCGDIVSNIVHTTVPGYESDWLCYGCLYHRLINMCASKPYWEDNGVFVKEEYESLRATVLKINNLKPKHFPISWVVEGKNELMNMKRSDVIKTLAMIFSKVRHFDFVEYYSELNVKRQTMKELIVKCGGYHRLLGDVRNFIVTNSIRILDTCFYNDDTDTSMNILEDLQLALLVLPYVSELTTPYLVSLVRAKGIKNIAALCENYIPIISKSFDQLNLKNKSINPGDLEKCGILQLLSSIFVLAYKQAYIQSAYMCYSVIDCRCGCEHEPYITNKIYMGRYRNAVGKLLAKSTGNIIALSPDANLTLVPLDIANEVICAYNCNSIDPSAPQPTIRMSPITDKYLSITGPDEFKRFMPISVSKRKAHVDTKQPQITEKEQDVLSYPEASASSSKVEEDLHDQAYTPCQSLEEAETKIAQKANDRFAAAEALRDIRDYKLYAPKYRSFSNYFQARLNFVSSYVYSMLKALEIRNKLLAVDSIREKKHCLPTTIMFFYSLRSLTFEEQQRAVFYILKKGVNRVNIYDLLEIVRPSNSVNADSTNQSYKKNFNEDELKREIALLVAKDDSANVINIQ